MMTLSEQEIEKIIQDEIEIDAYSDMEVCVGWEIYLEENITYPFSANYLVKSANGKENWARIEIVNRIEDQVENISSYVVEAAIHEIITQVRLSDLEGIQGNKDTKITIAVWQHAFVNKE